MEVSVAHCLVSIMFIAAKARPYTVGSSTVCGEDKAVMFFFTFFVRMMMGTMIGGAARSSHHAAFAAFVMSLPFAFVHGPDFDAIGVKALMIAIFGFVPYRAITPVSIMG